MLRTLWPCDSMIFEIPGTRVSKASGESTLLVFAVNNPRADEAWQTLVDGDFLFHRLSSPARLFPHASNTTAL